MRAIADVAQFVHDINNLLAVIGGGLRLLEDQSDAAYREAIVGKRQEALSQTQGLRNNRSPDFARGASVIAVESAGKAMISITARNSGLPGR